MKPQSKPIHIVCKKEDIAPLVIMPGDPLRAKYIAEKFLDNAKLVNEVRNMYAYTGTYNGIRVTVMGSGMGMPSMSIYAFELIYYYDVKKIIRIGTCGVITPEVNLRDIVLAENCYTLSNFAYNYNGSNNDLIYPSLELNKSILEYAKENNNKVCYGTILTVDAFGPYSEVDGVLNRVPKDVHPLIEEMECYALLFVAKLLHADATCMATVVDSKFSEDFLTPEERVQSLDTMIKLALNAIIK